MKFVKKLNYEIDHYKKLLGMTMNDQDSIKNWHRKISGRWITSCRKGVFMVTYTKILNGLTYLGIRKMQEHLDQYITMVNKGEKSFGEALEELI